MDNLTGPRSLTAHFRRALQMICAAAALIVGSIYAHAQTKSQMTPVAPAMKQFVIIFRQGPRTLTDVDKARRQEEVSAWARVQNAARRKLEPRILAPEVLRPGAQFHSGYDGWPISALLFFEASDLAEAAKVAESHPANRYGATVEVRPWAPPVTAASSAAR